MLELADHRGRLSKVGTREDQPNHDAAVLGVADLQVAFTKWRLSRIRLALSELDMCLRVEDPLVHHVVVFGIAGPKTST